MNPGCEHCDKSRVRGHLLLCMKPNRVDKRFGSAMAIVPRFVRKEHICKGFAWKQGYL